MAEMEEAYPSEGKGKLVNMPYQRAYVAMTLNAKKRQDEEILERNKKGINKTEKKFSSRRKSSDPPPKTRKGKDRNSRR